MIKAIYFLALFVLLSGCEDFKHSNLGKEGNPCFGNDTCREDLICQDGMCVHKDESSMDNDQDDQEDDQDYGDTGNNHKH